MCMYRHLHVCHLYSQYLHQRNVTLGIWTFIAIVECLACSPGTCTCSGYMECVQKKMMQSTPPRVKVSSFSSLPLKQIAKTDHPPHHTTCLACTLKMPSIVLHMELTQPSMTSLPPTDDPSTPTSDDAHTERERERDREFVLRK